MKTHGPGRYDDLCGHVMRESHAEAAVVLVFGGTRGDGFAVKTLDAALLLALPDILEDMARKLRVQVAKDARE